METLRPESITAVKDKRELTISWNDGHVSSYPFSLLRNGCPCAECRGGHDQMSREPAEEIFYMPDEDKPATHVAGIEHAGSYGISIQWEDGHQAGIYTWQYLRTMCPCPVCREMTIYGK